MKSGSLTPKGLHFLCLSPGDLKMAILLCSAETLDAHPTYIWLKDTSPDLAQRLEKVKVKCICKV